METQKRYWLFGCHYCDTDGGMRDFIGSFDTLPKAKIAGQAFYEHYLTVDYHVYDTKDRSILTMGELNEQW